ncbi:hypothetical protein ES705_39662 [subsurface metagenome]
MRRRTSTARAMASLMSPKPTTSSMASSTEVAGILSNSRSIEKANTRSLPFGLSLYLVIAEVFMATMSSPSSSRRLISLREAPTV